MKAKLVIILFFFGIFLSNASLARCGCVPTKSYCTEPESPCACTDNGWKDNDCMTKAAYCSAFGNVGALDE